MHFSSNNIKICWLSLTWAMFLLSMLCVEGVRAELNSPPQLLANAQAEQNWYNSSIRNQITFSINLRLSRQLRAPKATKFIRFGRSDAKNRNAFPSEEMVMVTNAL